MRVDRLIAGVCCLPADLGGDVTAECRAGDVTCIVVVLRLGEGVASALRSGDCPRIGASRTSTSFVVGVNVISSTTGPLFVFTTADSFNPIIWSMCRL